MFNVYEADEDTPEDEKLSRRDIRALKKVEIFRKNRKIELN